MARSGYTISSQTDVALVAATAKVVMGIRGGASFGLDLTGWSVSFDGIVAGAEPVTVELLRCTFATNPPGTNSTDIAANAAQSYGRTIPHGITAGSNWTAAPTVLTVIDEILIHPQAGVIYQMPLGTSPDSNENAGFAIRITAPSAVNVRATMKWEKI